jgi:hypothetical protein
MRSTRDAAVASMSAARPKWPRLRAMSEADMWSLPNAVKAPWDKRRRAQSSDPWSAATIRGVRPEIERRQGSAPASISAPKARRPWLEAAA